MRNLDCRSVAAAMSALPVSDGDRGVALASKDCSRRGFCWPPVHRNFQTARTPRAAALAMKPDAGIQRGCRLCPPFLSSAWLECWPCRAGKLSFPSRAEEVVTAAANSAGWIVGELVAQGRHVPVERQRAFGPGQDSWLARPWRRGILQDQAGLPGRGAVPRTGRRERRLSSARKAPPAQVPARRGMPPSPWRAARSCTGRTSQ